jgi:hypothetical protein
MFCVVGERGWFEKGAREGDDEHGPLQARRALGRGNSRQFEHGFPDVDHEWSCHELHLPIEDIGHRSSDHPLRNELG